MLSTSSEAGANTATLLAYSGHTTVASLARYARVYPDALGRWQQHRDPARRDADRRRSQRGRASCEPARACRVRPVPTAPASRPRAPAPAGCTTSPRRRRRGAGPGRAPAPGRVPARTDGAAPRSREHPRGVSTVRRTRPPTETAPASRARTSQPRRPLRLVHIRSTAATPSVAGWEWNGGRLGSAGRSPRTTCRLPGDVGRHVRVGPGSAPPSAAPAASEWGFLPWDDGSVGRGRVGPAPHRPHTVVSVSAGLGREPDAVVYLRDEVVRDDTRLMIRAGVTGLRPEKLRADALDAAEEIGIIGVSVIAALPGETLDEACRGTRLLANRRVVWWATAGALRAARFPCWPPPATSGTTPSRWRPSKTDC